jgi:hypothetical protein
MPRVVSLRRLYPAVGEFVIQYAVVQGMLRTLLLALLKVRGKGATTLVYGMSDDVVCRKIRVALTAYGRNFGKFKPALESLDKVATYRNQIIHWVPFINPQRTTIAAYVDAYRDYRNPNQPEVTCTPAGLRALCKWLYVFEGDLLQMLMAIDAKEAFDERACRTLDNAWQPVVPKSNYPART